MVTMSGTIQPSPLDPEKVLSILSEISILGGLSDEDLEVVLGLLHIELCAAGERVFEQGGTPSHIYIVRSGHIRIVANIDTEPLELVDFGVGQCFGETSVIGILPHSAAAVAIEDSELLVLPRPGLYGLHKDHPSLFGMLILNIAREACRRLYQTDQVLLQYAKGHEKAP